LIAFLRSPGAQHLNAIHASHPFHVESKHILSL
jgi:hypothetical protein